MQSPARGMSLIDVVIGSALVLIIFLGLFGLMKVSVLVSGAAKARAAAVALANTQMEYIRSLPYDSVGTVGGIPAGLAVQNATSTVDGTAYGVRTFVDYYDDPADGLGGADTNGITTDYKRAKITVTYYINTHAHTVAVISTIAPPGIESTNGGGTLKLSVLSATGLAVPGASVRIQNPSTSPTVDVTTFTDASGLVYLPGALVGTGYHVSVSKNGYSNAQTYPQTAQNQNPAPGDLTIAKNKITTGTFAIDQMATLTINTYSPGSSGSFVDTFTDGTKLATTSNTAVSGGALTLGKTGSSYTLAGSAQSLVTSVPYLAQWTSATTTSTIPAGTLVRVRMVDSTGTALPDAALPGNAAGFTSFPINLTGVSTTTYPSLAMKADLSSAATSTTPSLLDWTLVYQAGVAPLPNVSFSMTGAKTVGTTSGGAPIYKTSFSSVTSGTGAQVLNLEWDTYKLTVSGYDIIDACNLPPYSVQPGSAGAASLVLGPTTTNALFVTVKNGTGAPVSGAVVTLSRPGFTKTVSSTSCGTAYFGSVAAASDYTLSATSAGVTATYTSVNVSGFTSYGAAIQ